MKNHSMPSAMVIPVLSYPDVRAAARWLCEALGFRERLRIGDHRVQLEFDHQGSLVVAAAGPDAAPPSRVSVMIRVKDARLHHALAVEKGARILQPPTDFPYGERQYSLADPWGHHWTVSQSLADVDPSEWGGELIG